MQHQIGLSAQSDPESSLYPLPPASSLAPSPSWPAAAAQAQPPGSHQQNAKMAGILCGTVDKIMQSAAKIAAVSAATYEPRYSGMTSHMGG